MGAKPDAGAQTLQILQTLGPLSVRAGETLTLNCTLTGVGGPGGVKWHKGLDRSQPRIYSKKGNSSKRGTRIVAGSNTDFSININNVRPEDAGTYYCVKYRSGSPEKEELSGRGTEVSVIATPSPPSISGFKGRVESGALVNFNCSSDGFSPRDITVTWAKDGRAIQPSQIRVWPEGESISYQVWSTAEVRLTKEDVRSQLLCRITHNTLPSALEQSFSLGDVLRVPPNVRVETSPSSPVPLNDTVTFICNVEHFYPSNASLIWLENNTKSETAKVEPVTQNSDGTFSLKSTLDLIATEERNLSVFTCLVTHNSQPPLNETVTLLIRPQAEDGESTSDSETVLPRGEASCFKRVERIIAGTYDLQAHNHEGTGAQLDKTALVLTYYPPKGTWKCLKALKVLDTEVTLLMSSHSNAAFWITSACTNSVAEAKSLKDNCAVTQHTTCLSPPGSTNEAHQMVQSSVSR
ncbi:hypothetical protein JRQ81_014377 [Phrynocephalus forsythii]|uniref:Ig-like domain-containing protein n=1 Tax=Phrynocephalus forsythii TaxID=171643 RepID=A0A9Q0XX81_9SAUR|nr:hypothetical protein JRQ81_014377 [Phrynocephalus forsythii]